jgi:hypothetical protein
MVKFEERCPQPMTETILVQNWFEDLKRLFPHGQEFLLLETNCPSRCDFILKLFR